MAVAAALAVGISISFVIRDRHDNAQIRPALVPSEANVLSPQIQPPSSTRSTELSPSLGGFWRIQEIDLTKIPEIVAFADVTSGRIATKTAQFADLTGDGRDEVLVSVASGGTFGNYGYFVVTLDDGWPEVIREVTAKPSSRHGLTVEILDGSILETSRVYEPDDPNCCPSLLKRTYYEWDGQGFQMKSTEVVSGSGTEE